jgi:SAM-dependent methyltransferase
VTDPATLWRQRLKEGGYEHRCENQWQFRQLRKLPRVWRVIFRVTGLRRGARIFEVGCGGGIHLVRLALNGFDAHGIDVSPDVIQRAKKFIEEVRKFDSSVESIKLMVGDFMKVNLEEICVEAGYDLVFNAGVIEHYLDPDDRIEFLKRMLRLTKPGGFIVCIVPSGLHPYRAEQRQLKWGGYDIPEVDYSPEILADEMKRAGADRALAIPHNIGGYLLARPAKGWWKTGRSVAYLALQVVGLLMPDGFKRRHAYSYIGIGSKV